MGGHICQNEITTYSNRILQMQVVNNKKSVVLYHQYFTIIVKIMTMTDMAEKNVHEGRNVKRIREMLGVKQDALAFDLGLSQQAISQLEQKEALDSDVLEKIAKVLKVPVDAIKNFDEQAAINIISNTFNNNSHDSSSFYSSALNYQPTFNPIDKVVELYERMLIDKNEMIEKLEQILKERK